MSVVKFTEFPVDVRALTPAEKDTLKREAVQRAHAERARAMREPIKWLLSWWRPGMPAAPEDQRRICRERRDPH
jgi:hypothetical protein